MITFFSYSIIIKICGDFDFKRFNFKFEILLIVYWFAINIFLAFYLLISKSSNTHTYTHTHTTHTHRGAHNTLTPCTALPFFKQLQAIETFVKNVGTFCEWLK